MTTEAQILTLMRAAIDEARRSVPEDKNIHPRVGAVISDEYGSVVVSAFRGESGKGDHAEFLAISKAREKGITDFSSMILFATLEPCTHRSRGKTPCAQRIVEAGFQKVYIGALDPNPKISGHGEMYLRDKLFGNVERFPGALILELSEINSDFNELFRKSHLPSNSFYAKVRVTDFVLNDLRAAGLEIDTIPAESDFSVDDLIAYVCSIGAFGNRNEIADRVRSARAQAFDQKYYLYTYEYDLRKLGSRWRLELPAIMKKRFNIYDMPKRDVLNIGIGNGLEGVGLLENCENLICCDIASESLRVAQQRLPKATMIANSAETLENIDASSQDIYISLRTYQSALFDVRQAIRQAYRVLRPGGIVIISAASGYISEDDNSVVRGLVLHGTTAVDESRPHEIIKEIRYHLHKLRFDEVGVHSGKAEEYVFAKKRR